MTTGRHIVRDISCRQCDQIVGWKYDKAYETQEQYKENKFILEAELLVQVRPRFWPCRKQRRPMLLELQPRSTMDFDANCLRETEEGPVKSAPRDDAILAVRYLATFTARLFDRFFSPSGRTLCIVYIALRQIACFMAQIHGQALGFCWVVFYFYGLVFGVLCFYIRSFMA
jgi:hypothetical protein